MGDMGNRWYKGGVKVKKRFNNVYQFKITLRDIKPPIWRRIQVPETYTFWDLHVAIQDAMGWTDSHLHEFKIKDPKTGKMVNIGIPDEDRMYKILPEWKVKISKFFSEENPRANYTYDFGDDWRHLIQLEKIQPREKGVDYPRCIGGRRACPPEDCGGPWGYVELLEAIRDPEHEEHEEMLEWLGGEFDPEYFDIDEVEFTDPESRLKDLLQ
ncbi:MAG: Plasmid pRiA4b ORF-3 family protein [Synergistales bacterium 54_24]|nr:MAG: Plasmid pRiA4b ORF-3 family protein [Synergistales bacterium 54_24]